MVQLDSMETVLQDADYVAHIRADSSQTDVYLEVNYGGDEMGGDRILQISQIPLSDDGFTATQFIKFLVPFPFQAPSDRLADVARAITIINEELAIGHMGMGVQGNLHYQYCLALEQNATLAAEMLVELVALIEFQQEHFGDYLEGICDGEISVAVLDKVIQQTSP